MWSKPARNEGVQAPYVLLKAGLLFMLFYCFCPSVCRLMLRSAATANDTLGF